jgi:hypothetical protein
METQIEHLKTNRPKGFRPKPYYSADGDSLTFYFKNEESYGERVDDFLTVYKSMKTGELVGCQVKGAVEALGLLGDFGLLIHDKPHSVLLGMIFMACMAANPPTIPATKMIYLELGKMTKGAVIPARELEPVLA